MTLGVMYDTAQTYYQLSLAYQIGDATPTLHLFSSDDTPTASVGPGTYTELSNDSYAPLPVPNGYWQFLTSPSPGFYAVLGAEWDLGPPGLSGDTVTYGWWMDCFSPTLGITVALFGGRFDAPVPIPPAGLTLTLAQVQLPLHDCGLVPPPPPAPLLLDSFTDVNGTNLSAHTPEIGGPWTIDTLTWQIQSNRAVPADAVINIHAADAECGTGNVSITATLTPGNNSGGVLFRLTDASNYWWIECDNFAQQFRLVQYQAGVATTRAQVPATFAPSTEIVVRVHANNDQVVAFADDSVALAYVPATFNQAATRHGIWCYGATLPSVDSISVTAG